MAGTDHNYLLKLILAQDAVDLFQERIYLVTSFLLPEIPKMEKSFLTWEAVTPTESARLSEKTFTKPKACNL
jgi:hypothetical protein